MIIAAAQFTARPLDIGVNVAVMSELLAEAAERGASLVVFPELAVSGYELDAIVAGQDRLTLEPDDPRLLPLREACRAAGVTAVVNCAGRGPVIQSLVYGPDGELLTRYLKRCVTDTERAAGFTGGTEDGRFTVDGVRVGLLICYDAHFPELTAAAVADNCSLVVASSLYGRGGGVEERAELFPRLAKEHGMPVLLANHVGPAGSYVGCGLSAVWGVDGSVLAEAPGEAPGLALAEI
ncbi:carbon-nitrogen hydrolase family protein [Streptomyces orinoci]|uniref:Carbon-nitrogen hydrolase family protein n=1 Tax=Streptomyces orinoci TaxID=67339 RepID=A0ABV3JPX2_STRON|nr:carbon-nitrogen hydrolase family protein [Streptomyces orinoci]